MHDTCMVPVDRLQYDNVLTYVYSICIGGVFMFIPNELGHYRVVRHLMYALSLQYAPSPIYNEIYAI